MMTPERRAELEAVHVPSVLNPTWCADDAGDFLCVVRELLTALEETEAAVATLTAAVRHVLRAAAKLTDTTDGPVKPKQRRHCWNCYAYAAEHLDIDHESFCFFYPLQVALAAVVAGQEAANATLP